MRIERLVIEGFGHYYNREIGSFDRPLTLIQGHNEAGKSTMLAFIRAVLFGFPTTGGTKHYRPLSGGRHGGRIVFQLDNGHAYTAERIQGPRGGTLQVKRDEDGEVSDEAAFTSLIGGASQKLFRSMFTFDLDDLSSFNADAENMLYGVSMGAEQLPQTMKKLEERSNRLFKRQGRDQKVNQLLRALEETEALLSEMALQADEYHRLTDRRDQIAREMDDVAQRLELYGSQQREGELHQRAWEDWVHLNSLDEQLRALDDTGAFPPNGTNRLETAEKNIRDAKDGLGEAERLLAAAQRKIKPSFPDEKFLGSEAAIEGLRRGRGSVESSLSSLLNRQAELGPGEQELGRQLARLGQGWDEDRLFAFDLSISRYGEIEKWQQRFEELRVDVRLAGFANQQALSDTTSGPTLPERPAFVSRIAAALAVIAAILFIGVFVTVVASQDFAAVVLSIGGASALAAAGALAFGTRRAIVRPLPVSGRSLDAAQAADEKMNEEWNRWLTGSGLPADLDPKTARDLLRNVELAQVKAEELRKLRNRTEAIRKDIKQYRDRVERVAQSLGIDTDFADDRAAVEMADSIIDRFKAAQDEKGERDQANLLVDERVRNHNDADRRMNASQQELQRLLEAGNVETVEEFRHRAVVDEERSRLSQDRVQCYQRLRQVIGFEPSALEALNQVLRGTNLDEIQEGIRASKASIGETQKTREEFLEERGKVTREIKQLHDDDEASEARARAARLKEELETVALEWSSLVAARTILQRTQEKYERERQPAVIKRAEEFFNIFTDGRYPRVWRPLGESRITVSDHNGLEKTAEQLSRATKEQLYLALRFGNIEEAVSDHERLPVIVDEVLVNCDPNRAHRVAEAFVQLAEHTQVIVFTCHTWIADLFKEVADQPRVIELD